MANLVDSNQQKLSMQDIIKIAAQNTKSEYSFNQVFVSIMKELTMPDSIIIQLGNTVYVMHRVKGDPTTGVMRALNADTAQNYLENSEKFAGIAYNKYNIDTIVSYYTDRTLNNIFAYVGRNRPANMGFQINNMKDGSFQAIAKLGPEIDPNTIQQPQQQQGNI